MFAVLAAVIFGLAFILDLANVGLGPSVTLTTFLMAGLLCISLHLAGVGSAVRWPTRRSYRR